MSDSSVAIHTRDEEVQGQPQAATASPHDGVHTVHEVTVVTDKVILDPNDDLAVQVPEGSGASTYGHKSPLGEALSVGTPEEQFASSDDTDAQVDEPVPAKAEQKPSAKIEKSEKAADKS